VLVSEHFVSRGPELPPALVEQYRAWAKNDATRRFSSGAQALSEFVEASLLQAKGEDDAALESYRKAVSSLEQDRSSIEDDAARGTFLEDKVNLYYPPILQLLQRRRFDEAFQLLELSRSRAMADLLQNRELRLGRGKDQQLYAQSVVLRTRIGNLQNQLFELVSAGGHDQDARIAKIQDEVRKLETAQEQLVARTAAEAPKVMDLVVSRPVSLGTLQRAMRDEHFEVLQYLVLEHGVILWHIAGDALHVRNVFLPRREVISRVAALRKTLEDPDVPFDEAVAKEMYLFLVQPALPWIRTRRLIVIPHEHLHHVPFQVFLDPATNTFFGERFQISYAPSATILSAMRASAPIASARLFAVADPTITAAAEEVRVIARLFPRRTRVLSDALPAKSDLARGVEGFDLVHLSVHGRFLPGAPMLSYLALGERSGDDGKLTAAEMFGLPLDKARLVVLSACETGEAEATHADEILGPIRALLYAGAGALVVSYWKVDSAATAIWMRAFYRRSLRAPLAEGARLASMQVRSRPEYRHPFYWAAFILVGR
jgi:CHAT domain-containing protein